MSCTKLQEMMLKSWEFYFRSRNWHLDFETGFIKPHPPPLYQDINWKKKCVENYLEMIKISFYVDKIWQYLYQMGEDDMPLLKIKPVEIEQFEMNNNVILPDSLKYFVTCSIQLNLIGLNPVSEWYITSKETEPLIETISTVSNGPLKPTCPLSIDIETDEEDYKESHINGGSLFEEEDCFTVKNFHLLYGHGKNELDFYIKMSWKLGTSNHKLVNNLEALCGELQIEAEEKFMISPYDGLCRYLLYDHITSGSPEMTDEALKCLVVAGEEFIVKCFKDSLALEGSLHNKSGQEKTNPKDYLVWKEDNIDELNKDLILPTLPIEKFRGLGEPSDISMPLFSLVSRNELQKMEIFKNRNYLPPAYDNEMQAKLSIRLNEYFKVNPSFPQPGDIYIDRKRKNIILKVGIGFRLEERERLDDGLIELDLGDSSVVIDLLMEGVLEDFIESFNSFYLEDAFCILRKDDLKHLWEEYQQFLKKWDPSIELLIKQSLNNNL
eukprot:TRINITY_DN21564_c0_g1_i1.p1 TRINITY_DN21564_c0_g1~~TRINITY_DN21564_c0_g1_i1.p1  ORF type:complete len:546 (-),score=158.57 TRINITY_DN21564_c0_g1_i1:9-1493(-)